MDAKTTVQSFKINFLKFYTIWFGFVYFVGLGFLADQTHFVFMQVFSALGYIFLTRYYINYLEGYAGQTILNY